MSKLLEEFRGWLNDFDENINPTRDQLTMHNIYDTRIDKINIPRDHYICGLVSQEVYKDPKDRRKFISVYELDDRFNDERTVVYTSYYGLGFIIGLRGTANSMIDLASDFLIAVGKENLSIRKNRTIEHVKDIIKELSIEGYETKESFITGHSLGGLLTAYCMEATGTIRGIGFNTGSSPTQNKTISMLLGRLKPFLSDKRDNLKFTNYHIKGDLISASSIDLFIDNVILDTKPKPKSVIEAHKISYILKNTSPNPPLIHLNFFL